MLVVLLVARLVAPSGDGAMTVGDVEAAAFSAVEPFVDLRLLSFDETSRRVDAELRSCATDNRCIAARLAQHEIDRALYIVVSLESGFATAELLSKDSIAAIATEAVEINSAEGRAVPDAVIEAVTTALTAAGHQRGARLVVEVVPDNAIVRVASSTIAVGEGRYVSAGTHVIEAVAAGFARERREIVLAPGEDRTLRFELASESSVLESWWLWTLVAIVAASAVVIPLAAQPSGGQPTICYGDMARCEDR